MCKELENKNEFYRKRPHLRKKLGLRKWPLTLREDVNTVLKHPKSFNVKEGFLDVLASISFHDYINMKQKTAVCNILIWAHLSDNGRVLKSRQIVWKLSTKKPKWFKQKDLPIGPKPFEPNTILRKK